MFQQYYHQPNEFYSITLVAIDARSLSTTAESGTIRSASCIPKCAEVTSNVTIFQTLQSPWSFLFGKAYEKSILATSYP